MLQNPPINKFWGPLFDYFVDVKKSCFGDWEGEGGGGEGKGRGEGGKGEVGEWGALPWLGWLACCALPRLGLPCLDLL